MWKQFIFLLRRDCTYLKFSLLSISCISRRQSGRTGWTLQCYWGIPHWDEIEHNSHLKVETQLVPVIPGFSPTTWCGWAKTGNNWIHKQTDDHYSEMPVIWPSWHQCLACSMMIHHHFVIIIHGISVAVNYRYSRYKIDMKISIDNRYGFSDIDISSF